MWVVCGWGRVASVRFCGTTSNGFRLWAPNHSEQRSRKTVSMPRAPLGTTGTVLEPKHSDLEQNTQKRLHAKAATRRSVYPHSAHNTHPYSPGCLTLSKVKRKVNAKLGKLDKEESTRLRHRQHTESIMWGFFSNGFASRRKKKGELISLLVRATPRTFLARSLLLLLYCGGTSPSLSPVLPAAAVYDALGEFASRLAANLVLHICTSHRLSTGVQLYLVDFVSCCQSSGPPLACALFGTPHTTHAYPPA